MTDCRAKAVGHSWVVNLEVRTEPDCIKDYQVQIEEWGAGWYRLRMRPSRFDPVCRYFGRYIPSDKWAEKTAKDFCLELLEKDKK